MAASVTQRQNGLVCQDVSLQWLAPHQSVCPSAAKRIRRHTARVVFGAGSGPAAFERRKRVSSRSYHASGGLGRSSASSNIQNSES